MKRTSTDFLSQTLEELFERNSLLSDEEFLRKYPGIENVIGFIHEAAKTHYRLSGNYDLFDQLGVSTTDDFVELLGYGNENAIEKYKRICDILGF